MAKFLDDPLTQAVKNNDLDQVRQIFPRAATWEKNSILRYAYNFQASPTMVKLLLSFQVPFNFNPLPHEYNTIPTPSPGSPQARQWKKLFLDFKFGNPEAAYDDGVTNLMIASTTTDRPTIITSHRVTDRLICLAAYIQRGASLHEKDQDGYTALDYARDQGPRQAVQLLSQPKGKSLLEPIYYDRDNMKYLLNFPRVYEKIKQLGEGSFGAVYLVRDRTGAQLALKEMPGPEQDSYLREVALNQRLMTSDDPSFVKYFDHFTVVDIEEHHYLVFEYVEGTPISEYEFANKAALGKFLRELLRLMRKLESLGIHHNDLHGDNLMYDVSGQLRVLDLGQGCLVKQKNKPTAYDCPSRDDITHQVVWEFLTEGSPFYQWRTEPPAWSKEEVLELQRFLRDIEEETDWSKWSVREIRKYVGKYFPEVK